MVLVTLSEDGKPDQPVSVGTFRELRKASAALKGDGLLWRDGIIIMDDAAGLAEGDAFTWSPAHASGLLPQPWRNPMLHHEDVSMAEAHGRVSQVWIGKECVGTVARITTDGVCVSATHVFVEHGRFLTGAHAFGGEMHLLASFPYYDIIILQGPPGPAFNIAATPEVAPGRPVMLLAHPLAPQCDLEDQHRKPLAEPVEAHGRVVSVAATRELAAADYHAAMPNSSGGAVLFDSRTLAGTHVGTSYHLDTTHYSTHVGTSYHLDTTHYSTEAEEEADRQQIDRDPTAMWPQAQTEGQHGRSRKRPNRAESTEKLALHSVCNISHKDQLALFVPVSFISLLATNAGVFGPTALHRRASELGA